MQPPARTSITGPLVLGPARCLVSVTARGRPANSSHVEAWRLLIHGSLLPDGTAASDVGATRRKIHEMVRGVNVLMTEREVYSPLVD